MAFAQHNPQWESNVALVKQRQTPVLRHFTAKLLRKIKYKTNSLVFSRSQPNEEDFYNTKLPPFQSVLAMEVMQTLLLKIPL